MFLVYFNCLTMYIINKRIFKGFQPERYISNIHVSLWRYTILVGNPRYFRNEIKDTTMNCFDFD